MKTKMIFWIDTNSSELASAESHPPEKQTNVSKARGDVIFLGTRYIHTNPSDLITWGQSQRTWAAVVARVSRKGIWYFSPLLYYFPRVRFIKVVYRQKSPFSAYSHTRFNRLIKSYFPHAPFQWLL